MSEGATGWWLTGWRTSSGKYENREARPMPQWTAAEGMGIVGYTYSPGVASAWVRTGSDMPGFADVTTGIRVRNYNMACGRTRPGDDDAKAVATTRGRWRKMASASNASSRTINCADDLLGL